MDGARPIVNSRNRPRRKENDMKILYFDCVSGISGDMTLGALIDLGIDEKRFQSELQKLPLGGYKVIISKKAKGSIMGTDVDVVITEDVKDLHERNLKEIMAIIESSGLSVSAKNFSKKVFLEIAAAEAKVHGKKADEVCFHEIGAIDSIVDIVGTAVCLDLLGAQKVYASGLCDGRGSIRCRHGIIPVPVPAVMQMLSGSSIPFRQTDIATELITPTGMGIIKCLSAGFGSMPEMEITRVGYGTGKKKYNGPGVLRIVMGTVTDN